MSEYTQSDTTSKPPQSEGFTQYVRKRLTDIGIYQNALLLDYHLNKALGEQSYYDDYSRTSEFIEVKARLSELRSRGVPSITITAEDTNETQAGDAIDIQPKSESRR